MPGGVEPGQGVRREHRRDDRISPTRAFVKVATVLAITNWGTENDEGSHIDLSPLRGMALSTLGVLHTRITDPSPLKGHPIQFGARRSDTPTRFQTCI